MCHVCAWQRCNEECIGGDGAGLSWSAPWRLHKLMQATMMFEPGLCVCLIWIG